MEISDVLENIEARQLETVEENLSFADKNQCINKQVMPEFKKS